MDTFKLTPFFCNPIGLPTYVRARQIALGTNGPLPTTFDALKSTHSKEVREIHVSAALEFYRA